MNQRDSMTTNANDTSVRRDTYVRSISSLLVAAFGAAMIALAIGAVWLVLILSLPRLQVQDWLALPLAAVTGLLVRGWILDNSRPAAVLAALAMLLACAYMRVLLVASGLAGNFGMGFIEALRHAGPGMLVHLAWISLDASDIVLYAASSLVAGALAWRLAPRTRA